MPVITTKRICGSRALAFLLLCAALSALAFHSAPAQQPQVAQVSSDRRPVLVELFTSEGCSDCPPADALLADLDEKQFVPGADAIVLSEHVTYWNHEGWRDPFSFNAIDERQQDYERVFGVGDVYTPQMVVDGTEQFVGSNLQKLTTALQHEAATPKIAVQIEDAHTAQAGTVAFAVRLPAGTKGSLVAAVAENATVSEVSRGENAGRTLHHVAVVRVIKEFSSSAGDGRPLELTGSSLADADKTGTPLRLVVFLARRSDGRVLGAAEQTLRP